MGSATSIIRLSLEANQYEQGIRGAKKRFEDFTASIGINMKKMTAFGLAAGAAASAINSLAGSISTAFTEGTRMAKELEGVRSAFRRLDNPGLLDNLREATHGTVNDLELMKQAVKFDNFNLSLDQMGTMLAFAQQQAKDTGQDVGYLVDSIVTGLGRKSLPILDNLGLSATEIRERMKETGDMTEAVAQIIQERMNAAGGYVETASDRAAKATAELENAMTSLGETFSPLIGASDSLWTSIKIGAINALNTAVKPLIQALAEAGLLGQGARTNAWFNNLGGNSKVGRMTANLAGASEQNRQSIYQQQQQQFWKYINPREQQIRDIRAWQSGQRGEALQGRIGAIRDKYGSLDTTKIQAEVDAAKKMLADYQSSAKQILQPIKQEITPTITTSGGATGGSGSRGGDGPSMPKNVRWDNYADKAALAAVKAPEIEGASDVWNTMREAIVGCKEEMEDYSAETANWTKNFDPYRENMEKMTEAAKQQQMAFNMGADAAANLGGALASMEDPAAKAAGTVISAIANIALGFGQAVASAGKMGPWAWLAYVAAGTAALATTISTVHSLTGYANGGMIKGNSYSGDNIGGMVDGGAGGFVGLNAGEVVLNAAQQNTLAQNLSGNLRSIHVVGKISGTDIILSADRTLMTQGKQLAVWGR